MYNQEKTAGGAEIHFPQKKRSFRCRNLNKPRTRIADKESPLAKMEVNRRKAIIGHLTASRGIHVSELSELTGLRFRQCYAVLRELMAFGELETLPASQSSVGKRVRIKHFDFQQYFGAAA